MAGRSDRDRHPRTQRNSAAFLGECSGGSGSDCKEAATTYSRSMKYNRCGGVISQKTRAA
jgi:hypothetical protein